MAHLWCAEHVGADYFLTCDYTLVRATRSNRKLRLGVEVATPAELAADLCGRGLLSSQDVWKHGLKKVGRARKQPIASPLEELAALGDHLEREDYCDR